MCTSLSAAIVAEPYAPTPICGRSSCCAGFGMAPGRVFRIYPALIACVAFMVLLGALGAPDIKTYFDSTLLSFIGKDITLFTGVKAGVSHPVFAGNVLPNALNGSLWTLPYEVKLYVALAMCVAVLRYNSWSRWSWPDAPCWRWAWPRSIRS